jgi:hypothetical protein
MASGHRRGAGIAQSKTGSAAAAASKPHSANNLYRLFLRLKVGVQSGSPEEMAWPVTQKMLSAWKCWLTMYDCLK